MENIEINEDFYLSPDDKLILKKEKGRIRLEYTRRSDSNHFIVVSRYDSGTKRSEMYWISDVDLIKNIRYEMKTYPIITIEKI